MRCLNCDYMLWDLPPGACPECGEAFDPTTHDFRVNAVRFCCPHCDQAYFGDGEGGHLDPRSFRCVRCERDIDEASCIIRTLEGASPDDDVRPGRVPWFDRERRPWRRVLATAGWSMTQPARVGRELPSDLAARSGLGFFAIVQGTLVVSTLVTYGIFFGLMMASLGPGGGPRVPASMIALVITGITVVVAFGLSILGLAIAGAVAHGVLRLGGPTAGGIGRTIGAMGFGSGPLLLGAVPLIGTYCLGSVGGIWAIVSTILIVQGVQRVSGLRATLAVLAPIVVVVVIYAGTFAAIFAIGATGARVAPAPIATTFAAADPVAASFVGRSGPPSAAEAAALHPGIYDADATTVTLGGPGASGWFQRRELLLVLEDRTVLRGHYDPTTRRCTIQDAQDWGGGTVSSQPADAAEIHRLVVTALETAGAGKSIFTLDDARRWVELSSESDADRSAD